MGPLCARRNFPTPRNLSPIPTWKCPTTILALTPARAPWLKPAKPKRGVWVPAAVPPSRRPQVDGIERGKYVPFEGYGGFSFSRVSVQRNAPSMPGVYGLSNAREWVFVGGSDDIRATLLGHLQEGNTTLKSRAPTGFTFEICHPSQRAGRVSRLVAELSPVCNRGIVSKDARGEAEKNYLRAGASPGILRPLG